MYYIFNDLIGILPQRYGFLIPICIAILVLVIISVFIKIFSQ